jgi:hexokinase
MVTLVKLLEIKNNFVSALKLGETGQPTAMPFIIHQLHSSSVVQVGETFQVISIGGTNYQTGHVQVTHDGHFILTKEEFGERPFFNNGEDFLQFMAGIIDQKIDYLGLNFAFPCYPLFRNGFLDGTLKGSGKNDDFGTLVGKPLGETIENYLGNSLRVTVANDTICLLLSGSKKYPRSQLAAGIVGTGYNTAYFIDDIHPVNTQATSFSDFAASPTAIEINEQALSKGALFEKEVSGAYLYQHFNLAHGIQKQIESTDELDEIARDESHPNHLVAQKIFEHSAQLVSTHIAGIMEHKQRNMHFIMQGSVYWKAWNYKEMVNQWVKELCPQYTTHFFEVEDSDLWGAAYLLI